MFTHYILVEPWAVYVKEAKFFQSQGGLREPWGKDWVGVVADTIEDARTLGRAMEVNHGMVNRLGF